MAVIADEQFGDLRAKHEWLSAWVELRRRGGTYTVVYGFDPAEGSLLDSVVRLYENGRNLYEDLSLFGSVQHGLGQVSRNGYLHSGRWGSISGLKDKESAVAVFDYLCARIRMICAAVPDERCGRFRDRTPEWITREADLRRGEGEVKFKLRDENKARIKVDRKVAKIMERISGG